MAEPVYTPDNYVFDKQFKKAFPFLKADATKNMYGDCLKVVDGLSKDDNKIKRNKDIKEK